MQSSAAYKDQLWERQPAAEEFLSNTDNSSFVNQKFAGHILNNLAGMALLKAIDVVITLS